MPFMISKTLRLFLDSIGRRDEYEFYLKKFQAVRSACFALVFPDAASLRESGDLLAFDLQFLLQLDLKPLVILTGEEAEASAEILRKNLPVSVLQGLAIDAPIEEWTERLEPVYANQHLPLLIEPQASIDALVPQLTPHLSKRVHLLRLRGMLRDDAQQPIFYHCTQRDNAHRLNETDEELVAIASQWLEAQPSLHVSVSSPLNLLQEMFTVKGKGSIIRPGSNVQQVPTEQVDQSNLLQLFAEAFGKPIQNTDFLNDVTDYYLDDRYRGAALLESHPAGKYLSKFAVGTQARGEGLAQDLWEAACAGQEKLFWRARLNNPINQWYARHATGQHQSGDWVVFWIGIDADDLPGIIHYALDRPSDFKE